MIEELQSLMGQEPKGSEAGYIYSPDHMEMRLKEEMLRSHRQHVPFVFLKIPTKHFDLLGFEKHSSLIKAWKIAVLTVFSFKNPTDINGYLRNRSGLGLLLINKTDVDIQKIKKQILRNLRDANLLDKIKLSPSEPFFKAYYLSCQLEKKQLEIDQKLNQFNHTNDGFFTIEPFRYSELSKNYWNRQVMDWIKRIIDFAGSVIGLILLSPILCLVALIIKVSNPGPIFFRQGRVGKNGDTFKMWKFRSMYTDAEDRKKQLIAEGHNETEGPTFKMKNDPRITPIGSFIRKYSIDELPQLVNVLVGEMAIVGPRPPVPSEVLEYLPWHKMRLAVKPGLTCHWQVSGRSNIGFEEWMRLDNKYIRHGDLKTDIGLISKTFKAVVKGEGSY